MKWKCSEWRCGWHGDDEEILSAPDPFTTDGLIYGCPKCRTVESLVIVCDEPGCTAEGTCGWLSHTGYRRTCFKHWVR